MTRPAVRIAPNNPVFDLPVIVGIEEGLFDKAGLDVSFSATYADRERDSAEKPVLSRLKEQMFRVRLGRQLQRVRVGEHRSPRARQARRQHRGPARRGRGSGHPDFRRQAADAARPRRRSVVVQELTGSHYTTLQMLESAVGREHVKIQNGSLPSKRWEGLRDRTYRAVAVMEPFISLGLKEGRTSSPRRSIAAGRWWPPT